MAQTQTQCGEYGNVLKTAVARGSKRVVELLFPHGADTDTRAATAQVCPHARRKPPIARPSPQGRVNISPTRPERTEI